MFVAVVVAGSAIGLLTPVGGVFAAKICEAFGATCGSNPAEQRAKDLKVTCVQHKRDRDLGYNVKFKSVKGFRKDADSITKYGDGGATVVTTQGSGIGLEAELPNLPIPLGFKVGGSLNQDLGYVYRFPKEYGGGEAAQGFIDDRRSGFQQTAQIILPGLQTAEEGGTRAVDGVSNWVQDDVAPFLSGHKPSEQELAKRAQDQRKDTADAVLVALSLQGSFSY